MTDRRKSIFAMAFVSGFCALSYQVYWIRELRLTLGATTPAAATVLAVFMGGLGLGSVILGPRADRSRSPLRLYAWLESAVTVGAGVSPLLLRLAGTLHGSLFSGYAAGAASTTLLRAALAMLVLAVPSVAMGGTLPVLGRAIEDDSDSGRARWSMLYGLNTMGAIAGAAVPTLLLFEVLGARNTLIIACAVNALLTALAWHLSSRDATGEAGGESAAGMTACRAELPRLACLGAFLAGFAFFLAEIVWYRMLAPILGGTTYTFGLILAAVLSGIALGGVAYALRPGAKVPSPESLALVSAFEALALAVPFAAGDRVALAAAILGNAKVFGFVAFAAGWMAIIALVVIPAAFFAGVQFPMLLSLAGRGRTEVGWHAGVVTAFNTVGAVAGSLVGSFVLVPTIGAPACWRVAVVASIGVAGCAWAAGRKEIGRWMQVSIAVAALAILGAASGGPTAVWRHSGIGTGSFPAGGSDARVVENWIRFQKVGILRDVDGREASMAIIARDGLAFDLNGKIDGNAVGDAPTQILQGLLGALLHPSTPRKAFVVGLGTGSTAGWLAAVDSIERVDVAEIEPVVADFARMCAPVNRDAMTNPKVRIRFADGREFLRVAGEKFDLIVSEPSNPYRAGVASLYTSDFYLSAARKLNAGGIFVQWLQTYDIDSDTVWTVLVTLRSAFRHVEVWQTMIGDLALIATNSKPLRDAEALRARIASAPFREAFRATWLAADLEAVLGHFVAGPELADRLAADGRWQADTDDCNRIEYGFARSVRGVKSPMMSGLVQVARALGADRPAISGAVDWRLQEDHRAESFLLGNLSPFDSADEPERVDRLKFLAKYLAGDDTGGASFEAWRRWKRPARTDLQAIALADALADRGSTEARPLLERLSRNHPVEADMIRARLLWRQGRPDEAAKVLSGAFESLRRHPLVFVPLTRNCLNVLAPELCKGSARRAQQLCNALTEPFSARLLNYERLTAILRMTPEPAQAAQVVAAFEPDFPWNGELLSIRSETYRRLNHPLAAKSREEYRRYQAQDAGNVIHSFFLGSAVTSRGK